MRGRKVSTIGLPVHASAFTETLLFLGFLSGVKTPPSKPYTLRSGLGEGVDTGWIACASVGQAT